MLVACVVLVTLVVVLILLPLKVSVSLQGRGEPSGAWAVAAGTQIGPVAITSVAASGVRAMARAHVFGRQVWERPLSELRRATPEGDEPEKDALAAVRGGYGRFERWFDPAATARFLIGEHRRVRLESLTADLDYSFRDVVLTGQLMGAIYALGGMLPRRVVIRQKVSWKAEDRASVALASTVKVWPGRMVVDALIFVVRNVKVLRRGTGESSKGRGESDEREEDR